MSQDLLLMSYKSEKQLKAFTTWLLMNLE